MSKYQIILQRRESVVSCDPLPVPISVEPARYNTFFTVIFMEHCPGQPWVTSHCGEPSFHCRGRKFRDDPHRKFAKRPVPFIVNLRFNPGHP